MQTTPAGVEIATYVSLRNSPLPYGPPIACRTTRNWALMELGMRMLKKIGYHGVAHMDFRRDQRDGQPKLLDFNARLAGTDEISALSGVNFAHLVYRLALGEEPEPTFDGQTGLEFRWILGELRHLTQTDRKLRVVRRLCKWSNVSTDMWFTDPLPHVRHVLGRLLSHSLSRKNE